MNNTKNKIAISFEENLFIVDKQLTVYVMSNGDWGWALTWYQMGVTVIRCMALTEEAKIELDKLRSYPRWTMHLQPWEDLGDLPRGPKVVSCHLVKGEGKSKLETLRRCRELASTPDTVTFASICFGKSWAKTVKETLGKQWHWQTVRHQTIGGLTSAARDLGVATYWATRSEARIGLENYPKRPMGRFLEASVKLTKDGRVWDRNTPCWRPLKYDEPCPWPWRNKEVVVEAPTCYKGPGIYNGMVRRHLFAKEKMQLLDLNEDWGEATVHQVWNWNKGGPTPLRMLAEFIRVVDQEWKEREGRDTGAGQEGEVTKAPLVDENQGVVDLSDLTDAGSLQRMEYFGLVWETRNTVVAGAAKADDATVDVSLWAVGGDGPGMEEARAMLRKTFFRRWRRRLVLEAARWLQSEEAAEEYAENQEAICDCIRRCANSTWWEWTDGSRLLFWRWPRAWRREARDGARGYHKSYPQPNLKYPQVPMQEQWIIDKDREKLEKLLRRRYIVKGSVRNTVPRFPVPKGSDDIRVVWDLAKNGLNECMFTPSFFLPTMPTYLRRVAAGAHHGDFDIGEQFHNYVLHQAEQQFCGVEVPCDLVAKLQAEGLEVESLMRWGRLVFGWQSSPYYALRMLARAMEIAKGAPDEPNSAFGWEAVRLNLPGCSRYDPSQPRVQKLTRKGELATELVIYFDDGRVSGATREAARQGTRQIVARCQYLGNQDAARKRSAVSQRPHAWAGGVLFTDLGICRKTVTQEKWDRAKDFLRWVDQGVRVGIPLDFKKFRSGKGFLLHVTQTFDVARPYLKGFHLAENSWRPGRDAEGWKIPAQTRQDGNNQHEAHFEEIDSDAEWEQDFQDGAASFCNTSFREERDPLVAEVTEKGELQPPQVISFFPPRLVDDVEALLHFFAPETPIQVLVRPVAGACFVAYGAGDASGEGFGSRIRPLGLEPLLRRGFWCTEESENSSNWREMRNLLDALKLEVEMGRLVGRELWLATDNSTAALAYFNGSSNSRTLHEMVIELRELTLKGNFVLQIFHIAGSRMIQIGVDALSRGELHVGALAQTPDSVAPLHKTPLERSPGLREWIRSWVGDDFKVAAPDDWFYHAHQGGQVEQERVASETWIWELAPAAAIHALEELGTARLKRHDILRGIVVLPNLLTHEWFRRFVKVVDCFLTIPAGAIDAWPESMHEGLTIGFYFPLLRHEPWCWRRLPFLVQLCIKMSKMYKAGDASAGGNLRKFWEASICLAAMPKRVVRRVLQDANGYRFLHLSPSGRRR